MALPDPIPTLTVSAVTYDFARIGMDGTSSIYQTANGNDRLLISHQNKNRFRTTARFDRRKIAANPLDASLNQEYTMSTYVVWDVPKTGFTSTEIVAHSQLLSDFLVAGTPDYGLRVVQGEV